MGFLDIFKPKTDVLLFEHYGGIPFVNTKEIITLLFEDCLKIRHNKETKITIEYQNIKNAEILKEIESKDKSALGGVLVGGLLLGVVGAVVGGVTASGKNKKENYFLKITYTNNNENKELYLKGLFNSFNICEIAQKQIKEKCSS